MKNTFTATDLKRNTSDVFNEVQRVGTVSITNKSRPDMVLMTKDCLNEMLNTLVSELKKTNGKG